MSHNHGGMSMGSMALPALPEFPKFYYAVVGSAVAVATLANIYNHILYRQRLSAARAGTLSPAKPKSWFPRWNATIFAVTREASNYSVRLPLKGRSLRLPTFGRTSLVLANMIVLLVLCFYGLNLTNQFQKENVGFRCGVVTIGQLPLIFLLSGKNNIIGWLTGVSYERLNWLHRWAARCMLLTATIHMGYFFSAWAPYDYIGAQFKQNNLVWRGLAAWCVLVWINLSSTTPIRGWNYELFVVQHVASFALFIGFVYIHAPPELKGYVWAAVALFFFDRIFRALRVVYANLSIFHPSRTRDGLWTCKAEFTPLSHDTTRITVTNPPISWCPGQHVFLSCQGIAPLQNHPFTIASIPEDGKMEFLVKAQSGGTRRFFKHAQKSQGLFDKDSRPKTVTVEGPYGRHRPLRQFDSVVLLAGSTGATFTVPLLRDVVQGWRENNERPATASSLFSSPKGAVTRHVRFVWVVKSRGQLEMFSEQLSSAYSDFQTLQEQMRGLKLEVTVYVTCDESFTEEHRSLLSNVTAPKTSSTLKSKAVEHGVVEVRSRASGEGQDMKDMKDEAKELTTISSRSTDEETNACCCRATVEEASTSTPKPCCCSTSANAAPRSSTRTSTSSTPPSRKQTLLVHPSIQIFSGRPQIKDIIRRSLEQALGESAVVVCGPQGLLSDVKQSVVELSDERAVHKGTGAQGVYSHTEGFGY
ncbi:ferric-chelate reductase Frp1 [Ascochyta rabiei]|uniref:ferric-chelate reductase (NADPH) n=1 Tax=Didymella rabiei TaxID=5454 RepID=A0A162W517_DIDRA|nr:ferric-chelate reductase Frp1 [Ascochyta rabiei]KZM18801.1 oxidoreductase [Ascochyta rabiei]UPX16133.1 ferric-chelate reductase Frp1 [Ascochyta rabiei]